jgi:glucokinase
MPNFTIGVDLGGTNLRIAAVEDTGRILELTTLATEVSQGRDKVITNMCEAIRALAAKFQPQHSLLGIGIGVPGIIDMASGTVRNSPNLPDWQDYPVRTDIERRLNTQVVLENDANSAALGEKWMGAGREHDSLCMLTLGTGVGGGIVLEGRVWHGMTGMAGELGHVSVEPQGAQCGCGNRGCLEQYASATAIKRMGMEAVSSGKAPELGRQMSGNPELTSKHIYQLAIEGDAAAAQIFERVGETIGIALATYINALNLPIYVVGGGVSSAWDAFAPRMMREVEQRSFVFRATRPDDPLNSSGRRTVITRALLGSDAGLLGAARLPMLAHAEQLQAR